MAIKNIHLWKLKWHGLLCKWKHWCKANVHGKLLNGIILIPKNLIDNIYVQFTLFIYSTNCWNSDKNKCCRLVSLFIWMGILSTIPKIWSQTTVSFPIPIISLCVFTFYFLYFYSLIHLTVLSLPVNLGPSVVSWAVLVAY